MRSGIRAKAAANVGAHGAIRVRDLFARCADAFNKRGRPDMSHVVAIAAEHGIHFVKP